MCGVNIDVMVSSHVFFSLLLDFSAIHIWCSKFSINAESTQIASSKILFILSISFGSISTNVAISIFPFFPMLNPEFVAFALPTNPLLLSIIYVFACKSNRIYISHPFSFPFRIIEKSVLPFKISSIRNRTNNLLLFILASIQLFRYSKDGSLQ